MAKYTILGLFAFLLSAPAWVYTYNIINFTDDVYYPKVVWGVETAPQPVSTTKKTLKVPQGSVLPPTVVRFRSDLDKVNFVASLLPLGSMVSVTHATTLDALLIYNGSFFLSPTATPDENKAILFDSTMTANDKTLKLLKKTNRVEDYVAFSTKLPIVLPGLGVFRSNIKGAVPPDGITLAIVPKPVFTIYPDFDVIPVAELGAYWEKWSAAMRSAMQRQNYSSPVRALEVFLPKVIAQSKLYGLPTNGLDTVLSVIADIKRRQTR